MQNDDYARGRINILLDEIHPSQRRSVPRESQRKIFVVTQNFFPSFAKELGRSFCYPRNRICGSFLCFIGEKMMFRYLLKEEMKKLELLQKRQQMIRINKEQIKHFW